jgi:hypothetical protein
MAIPRGLVLALDLVRAPMLAETMRRQPLLPSKEILVLLRIAGGCPETSREAVETTGKSSKDIKDAVALYLKQVLLYPDADSYRILGVDPLAPQETVREHLHWMMRWLHPDRNRDSWETVFACRVLSAWEDLKSPLKREDYNRRRRRQIMVAPTNPHARQGATRIPWIATPLTREKRRGRVLIPVLVLASFVGLGAWFTLSHRLSLSADEAGANAKPLSQPAIWEQWLPATQSTEMDHREK